jgi:hypothetical protein
MTTSTDGVANRDPDMPAGKYHDTRRLLPRTDEMGHNCEQLFPDREGRS